MGFYLNKEIVIFSNMKVICTLVLICTAFARISADKQTKIELAFTCEEVQDMKDTFMDKFIAYEFKITTNRGSYWNCREQCLDMGGDLLYHSFGEEGLQYHDEIKHLVNQQYDKNFWIGVNDLGVEGSFRMLNGTKFEIGQNSLYDWTDYMNSPDNHDGGEDCVHIWTNYLGLNDLPCSRHEGVFGDGKSLYGLCEIPKLKNCKSN